LGTDHGLQEKYRRLLPVTLKKRMIDYERHTPA